MAEHMNQPPTERMDGFDAMGKPIPPAQRQKGYDTCKEMGLTDSARAWECVNGMAEQLERDKPHEAIGVAMRFLDLTGAYRLMAVLLTGEHPDKPASLPPTPPEPRTARTPLRSPVARLHTTSANQTVWHVEVPVSPKKTTIASKLYLATTYPDSDLVFIQSAARGRAINAKASTRLLPLIRDAIKAAQAAPHPTGDTQ